MGRFLRLATILALVVTASAARAQWGGDPTAGPYGKKGEGAVVIRDGAKVYEDSKGEEVAHTLKRGTYVVGFTKVFMGMGEYEFMEKHGRYQVAFPVEDTAVLKGGWMQPDDLSRFFYDCGCAASCAPVTGTLKQARWNPCFLEAAEAKLDRLRGQWAATTRPAEPKTAPPAHPASKEKALTNADVVALCKADLGDQVVIAKIQQAPNEALDVSTEALMALKSQGVPKPVIQAMVTRAGQRR
jgi:hypothetical protein